MSKVTKPKLPAIARNYLRTRQSTKAQRIVEQLHRWMEQSNLKLEQLKSLHVDELLDRPFGKVLAKRTRYEYRGELLAYLERLYATGRVSFDPSKLRRGRLHKRPLPPLAKQFVEMLEVTLRPGTCSCYRTSLRSIHHWLNANGVALKELERQHTVRWFRYLNDRGLRPATRLHIIVDVRAYLRWLHERGLLQNEPDLLIRRTDLPKVPDLLPRPLCPAADRALQARLRESTCPDWQALLLMRNTGMRIGELIRLEYGCLRSDPRGNTFVKVPLGKLNNDRVVPVDAEIAGLVKKLQCSGQPDRPWLLPTPPAPLGMPQRRPIDRRGGPRLPTYRCLYARLRRALQHACNGIDIDGRMTTHRLRHTYATTLLSGGMSLVGLMRLLGHRSYKTTLRYAAVTQETISKQYFEALLELDKRYQLQLHRSDAAEPDPLQMLSDVVRWIDKHVAHDHDQPRTARRLTKRIERIRNELRQLLPHADDS